MNHEALANEAARRLILIDPVAAALHQAALDGEFGPDNQRNARERQLGPICPNCGIRTATHNIADPNNCTCDHCHVAALDHGRLHLTPEERGEA